MEGKFTSIDLAYVAGFFDGEGNVGIYKSTRAESGRSNYAVSMGIANTDRATLEYIQGLLGGTLSEKTANRRRGNKPLYALEWHCVKARDVLRLLLPYLKTKYEQAELAISYQDSIVSHKYRDTQFDKDLKEIFYQMSKNLKRG